MFVFLVRLLQQDKDNRPVVDASGLPVARDAAHPFYPFHVPF